MTRWPLWLLLTLSLSITLAGCSVSEGRLVDADQPNWDGTSTVALAPGSTAGQTFVARHGGLTAIEILLLPASTSDQDKERARRDITLHLREEPNAARDLATGTVEIPLDGDPAGEGIFSRLSFPVQPDSHGRYYYAFLESNGPQLEAATGPGDAYLDGAAYVNHEPLDAQLVFRLVYAPRYTLLDLIEAGMRGGGLLAVAALLFVLPGWAVVVWLPGGRRLGWGEKLGLAVGASLALYPVLFLWTDIVGLHLGPLYAWLPVALGLVGTLWHYLSARPALRDSFRRWLDSGHLWPDVALVLVLGLVFAVRLLAVRSLDAPMWGDSFQHSTIAQLLVDNGGLFDSWAPYAEIDGFTYHFGFHTAVAVLHWLGGLPVVASTLWAGQLLNGLAVLALYPLAVRVTGSRWGGVWAVLFAGLLSVMPMFYTNWGRYTQLAGLAILPAAVWLTWALVDAPESRGQRPAIILAVALVVGGLALTHYRVLLFYGCAAIALLLVSLTMGFGRRLLRGMAWAGAGTVVVCLPWLLNALGSTLQQMVVVHATTLPDQAHPFVADYNAIGALDTFLHPIGWLALAIGLGLGLWRRRHGMLLTGLWWLTLLIATNPAWLSLPGTGLITNFALFLAAYFPAALAVGYLAATCLEGRRQRRWLQALALLVTVIAGVWGAGQRLSDIDPATHALVTRPDLRAAEWIRENTPPGSRFLIDAFPAYGGTSIVGGDAGWWLPLLAGRSTTIPPLAYSTELSLDSDIRAEIKALAERAEGNHWDDPALLDLLAEQGVTHVYVGQRRGAVNQARTRTIVPEQLLASPSYRAVYHQDRVWIFQVVGAGEEAEGS